MHPTAAVRTRAAALALAVLLLVLVAGCGGDPGPSAAQVRRDVKNRLTLVREKIVARTALAPDRTVLDVVLPNTAIVTHRQDWGYGINGQKRVSLFYRKTQAGHWKLMTILPTHAT